MEAIVLVVAGVAIGGIARSLIASVVGEEIRQLEKQRDELVRSIEKLNAGLDEASETFARMESQLPTSSQGGSS